MPATEELNREDYDAQWLSRINRARERREQFESLWALYARLHTSAYKAARDKNEDASVDLPNGDQVKVHLIHRNIEQTLAVLDMPEIGVRATATDYTHDLGAGDTHREAVVEQGVYQSLMQSGMFRGREEIDYLTRDAICCGHAVNFTYWRQVTAPVTVAAPPLLVDDGAGYQPGGEAGELSLDVVRWEGCTDSWVPATEFLFDASARRIADSPWHGFERIVDLAMLRRDARYTIPDDVVGQTYQISDLYQETADASEIHDAVKMYVIWDRNDYTLHTFLDQPLRERSGLKGRNRKKSNAARDNRSLLHIAHEPWPLTFAHPDDSPFTWFIPMPAQYHPFGISQVEHARIVALEADKLRTRQANQVRQMKRIIWYRKGRMDQDELEKAIQSPDMVPVGLDLMESEKPEQLFGELPLPTSSAELGKHYAIAEDDVRKTSGISEVPWGGAETATESENIMAVGGARVNRKRQRKMLFLSEVASRHKDYMREFAPSGRTIVIPDADGLPLTLPYGREAFEGEFLMSVLPGGGAMTLSPVKQKLLLEASNLMMGRFGPAFDRVYLRQMMTMFDFRDINSLMRAMGEGGAPGLPGAGVPAAGEALANVSNPQAIRAAINAPYESARR